MTPPQPLTQTPRAAASASTAPRQRGQHNARHRTQPLTDDQYLATSLALVANLALRVREGRPHHG